MRYHWIQIIIEEKYWSKPAEKRKYITYRTLSSITNKLNKSHYYAFNSDNLQQHV